MPIARCPRVETLVLVILKSPVELSASVATVMPSPLSPYVVIVPDRMTTPAS